MGGRAKFKKGNHKLPSSQHHQQKNDNCDPLAWLDDVDTNGEITPDDLYKCYNIAPCKLSQAKHEKKDCKRNPLCITNLRTQKLNGQGIKELQMNVIGLPPVEEETVDDADASSIYLERGLRNPHNTCFLNAIVQMLFHMKPLRDAIFHVASERFKGTKKSTQAAHGDLLDSFLKLFAQLAISNRKVIDAKEFITAFNIDQHIQQDAQELCVMLVQFLAEQPTLGKTLDAMLKGTLLYKRTCSNCNTPSMKSDPFSVLSLHVTASLEDSLASFTLAEEMEEYKCEKCEKKGATSIAHFKILPDVLMFHMVRFKYNAKFEKVKLCDNITFPTELDMQQHIGGGKKDDSIPYKLVSVVNHIGSSAESGHYVLHHRVQGKEEWMCYDDSSVSSVNDKYNKKARVSSKDCYILIYERVNSTAVAAATPDAKPEKDKVVTVEPEHTSKLQEALKLQVPAQLCNIVEDEDKKLKELALEYSKQKQHFTAQFNEWKDQQADVFVNLPTVPDDPLFAVPRNWLKYSNTLVVQIDALHNSLDGFTIADNEGRVDGGGLSASQVVDSCQQLHEVLCRDNAEWSTHEALAKCGHLVH